MATNNGELETKKCNQEELFKIHAKKPNNLMVGATTNVADYAAKYKSKGYSGTMYYAATDNMKMKANKLLHDNPGKYNENERSGVPETEGFIYVIRGKKD